MPKHPGAPVRPGDRILLHDGPHGDLVVRGAYNDGWITIATAPGATLTLRSITVQGAARWVFSGLTVTPSLSPRYD